MSDVPCKEADLECHWNQEVSLRFLRIKGLISDGDTMYKVVPRNAINMMNKNTGFVKFRCHLKQKKA